MCGGQGLTLTSSLGPFLLAAVAAGILDRLGGGTLTVFLSLVHLLDVRRRQSLLREHQPGHFWEAWVARFHFESGLG